MSKSLTYAFGIAVLLVASMLVVAEDKDPCALLSVNNSVESCKQCVLTVANKTANENCTFIYNTGGDNCVSKPDLGESVHKLLTVDDCIKTFNGDVPTTGPPVPTTPTTTATTTSPSTTTTTTTETPKTTNGSTTTQIPTTTSPTTTTTTTAPVPTTTTTPTNVTTSTVSPPTSSTTAKPEPRGGGGMSFASFFGGIVFTLCMSGLGYLIWRFYRARMDRNYHTFANPTF